MIEPGLTQSIQALNQNGLLDDQQIMPTKVLVIDDDSDTTDLLRIILEPNAFEVITANKGEEGVELVRSASPDVVVVDLLMPGMDGLKVLHAIRAFSAIPVLVLSAVNKPNIAAQALNSGADEFLIKPMSSSVLVASLNMLARRARVERQAKEDDSRRNGGSSVRANESPSELL
jgi:DNA-binding response OmpR family regulator